MIMLAWKNGRRDVLGAYLERVFPRKALVAVVAREGLDSQVDPLVSLQVVVPVEALRTLIALEWSIVCAWLLVGRVAHEVRHCCCMATVEARHHARVYTTNKRKLTIRVLDVREDGCWAWLVPRRWWSLIWIGRMLWIV